MNKKFNTKYDTNHSAIDSHLYEVLKNKIKKYIESTDYPIQPTYQRYFGKIERTNTRPNLVERRLRFLSSTSTGSSPTHEILSKKK